MPSVPQLGFAVLGGLGICLGGKGYFSWKIQKGFIESEYTKKSIELLNGYQAAKDLMGDNIKTVNVDLRDKFLFCDGIKANMVYNIVGPKTVGKLYSWNSRKLYEDPWNVDQLDLQVKGHARFTFYKDSTETVSQNTPEMSS